MHFGDYLVEKHTDSIRIGFQNFNGMSGKSNNPVDESLKNWITANSFDVFGIPEVNLFWPKVHRSLQFHERIRYWWQPGQHQSVIAYNRNEKRKIRSIRQYGGTAQISRENAALRIQDYGECRKLVPVGSIAVDKSLVAGIEVCLQNKLPIIKA